MIVDAHYHLDERADGGYDHGHILGQLQRWSLPAADTERLLASTFREVANL